MVENIVKLFERFAYETGILADVRQYSEFGMKCLLVLGVLAVFMGFKIYRAVFSVAVFMTIATVSSMLLTGKAGWGEIVTCFAVLGSVIAFLAYKWHYLGGITLSALAAAGLCLAAGCPAIAAVAAAIVAGILVILFPVITVCLVTALFGVSVISELVVIPGGIPVMLVLAAAGFAVQLATNRKQDVFAKRYPDAVKHWMEQRKRKNNADSL